MNSIKVLSILCTLSLVLCDANWAVHFSNNGGCGGGCGCDGGSSSMGSHRQTFVIGSEDSFPPFSTTGNGVVEGLSIDLLNAAAAAGGCDIDWAGVIWRDCLRGQYPVEPALTSSSLSWYLGPALKNGAVDACASTGVDPERRMVINYSNAYVMGPRPSIITPVNSGITSLAQLTSVSWDEASFINNGILNSFQAGLSAQVTNQVPTTQGGSDAVLALASAGTVQGAIIGSNRIPTSGWRVLGSIAGSPVALGVAKGAQGKALLACINPGISQILSNGVASNICQQWVAKANGVDALIPDCNTPQ
eukprot:TRINITY_DN67868_c3_g4_i1.p1 TRINITY_DN67868_c3_g4~~TRINITY_DN67868_c3_g4_i1.p1  ORF type:complete len:305 (-),score=63.98 TRINITY_DN67868_c3_g4_i1:177-1091(-)